MGKATRSGFKSNCGLHFQMLRGTSSLGISNTKQQARSPAHGICKNSSGLCSLQGIPSKFLIDQEKSYFQGITCLHNSRCSKITPIYAKASPIVQHRIHFRTLNLS